jgi:hypothetical protein
MPQLTLELGTEKLKELLFQLPPREFLSLAAAIEQRAETLAMMRLAETGFREWNEPGEEIYDEG